MGALWDSLEICQRWFNTEVGICSLKGKTGTTALCLTLSIFLLFLSVLSTYGYDLYHSWRTGEDYASYQYDSSSIGACDYVPTTFVQKGDADIFAWEDALIKRGQTVTCSNPNTQFTYAASFDSITVEYASTNANSTFEFPRIYYKGYAVTNTATGETLDTTKSALGLVQATTTGESGTLTMTYAGTTLQHVTPLVSAIALIGLIVFYLLAKTRHRKEAVYQ